MNLEKIPPERFIMPYPTYPDFPYSEYQDRIARAKKSMAANGVDVLVMFKRENIRYFCGYQTTHWYIPSIQPGVLIIPLDKDPVLVVPDLLLTDAVLQTWVKDIWIQHKPHEVKVTRALPGDLAKIMKDMGLGSKRIGLEMGQWGGMWIPRPLNDIQAFMAGLPDAKWVDGDKTIWRCRMFKTALEVDRIQQACAVTAKMHSAVIEGFRPGMSEMEVGKLIHAVEVESGDFRGDDAIVTASITCNLEKEGMADILALDGVQISKNDYMKVDLLHRHKGYWADVARCFQVGPLTDRMRRNYDLCEAGLVSATELLKPGITASEVWRAATKPISDAGIAPLEMAGHGIGMDVHEPPSIDATNDFLIEEGMVLAIEVWIYKSPKRSGGEGSFAFEEEFVVTDKGCARMSGFTRKIVQVSHPIL